MEEEKDEMYDSSGVVTTRSGRVKKKTTYSHKEVTPCVSHSYKIGEIASNIMGMNGDKNKIILNTLLQHLQGKK